jgi:uncharacterized protein
MDTPPAPRFRELDREASEAILRRNHVGRLAFAHHGRVDIEPIHYVYADGVVNCRTSPGTKTDVLRHQPSVAFEVDEVDGLFSWRSVVVRGSVYVAEPVGSEVERAAYQSAVNHLKCLLPGAFTEADPTGFRSIVLRLHAHEITGREASPA